MAPKKPTLAKAPTKKVEKKVKVVATEPKKEEVAVVAKPPAKKVSTKQVYYEAIGRRREAVARVRLYVPTKGQKTVVNGKEYAPGTIIVNDKLSTVFFGFVTDVKVYSRPLIVTETTERFVVSTMVRGGGRIGQMEAISHGIARGLCEIPDSDLRLKLKQLGLLSRDARTRERRMVGTGGKSRRLKQSPKR